MTAIGICVMYMAAEAYRSMIVAGLCSLEISDKYLLGNEQEEVHHMCMR